MALTIAGSDPSGGAGLQADLKTFHRLGVYGQAVVTLVTVQDRRRVFRVEVLEPALVREQIEAVVRDQPPAAAKTGALGSREIVEAVARMPLDCPLVVDPIIVSSRGTPLLPEVALDALAKCLLPKAYLLMPNLAEAEVLCGFPVDDLAAMRRASEVLRSMGARNVLVKGGHLKGEPVDVLLEENGHIEEFSAERVTTGETHGTGCTYSAAITAELAHGTPLAEAIAKSKVFVTNAIRWGWGGVLDHHA